MAVGLAAILLGVGIAWWWSTYDREAEEARASQPAAPPRPSGPLEVTFVGDSITEDDLPGGFNAESGGRPWPSLMEDSPDSPWVVKENVAIAGRQMTEWRASFRYGVLGQAPEGVVILLGTNDASKDEPLEAVTGALAEMLTQAEEQEVPAWVISPPPNDNYTGRVQAVVDAEREIAAEYDVPFIDLFEALGDQGRWADPAWTEDGTHPSRLGQEQIADFVLSQVRR